MQKIISRTSYQSIKLFSKSNALRKMQFIPNRLLTRLSTGSQYFSTNNRGSSIFDLDEESSFIDIGEAPTYKGSLVIVPTPIGNLGDLSVR